MSESETTEVTDQETKHENNNPRKRVRHRKKQLYENILKQMEFYFSDANLTKDRFLGDLVKNDPYVPLDTFLRCNKIRSMTQDVNDIAKAMKNSTLLELSEDKTKVQRKIPVMPYDADQRTIYVESIPVTASRDWLQRVFSDYGQVAYISLPSFKNSKRIKGFGFIEFSKPEEAQKCLNAFTKMGCKLPTCMPPEELSSIKMFSIPEESVEGQQDSKIDKEEEPPKKKRKTKEKKPKQLELKPSQESDCEKREKPTEENKSITEVRFQDETKSITTPTEETKTPDTESKEELTSQDEGKTDATPRKKKTRKRTAKERSKAKNSLGPNEAPKGALWGLQVLPKSEWKLLRNKYLNLQRKYMKELKANLQNKRHAYSSIPAPAAPSAVLEPVIVPQEAEGAKTVGPLERVPGVFVKEVLSEPCLDVRLTKRTIRSNIHVLHVDAKEGQSEVVIRFDSSKSAEEYCSHSNNRAQVITGAAENEQWSRAEAARSHKRARGRARILAKGQALDTGAAVAPASPQPTSTHIRFDE